MSGLIIEGVAGTGKSTLLQLIKNNALLQKKFPSTRVWEEDHTLGELVAELRDPQLSDEQRFLRLIKLLPDVKQSVQKGEFVILERFHHSYFALMPHWHLVDRIDDDLMRLGFATVLLHLPENSIEERCFCRAEQDSSFSDNLVAWYGSKEKALAAFIASQRNRLAMLSKSRLPSLIIDTGEKQWSRYERDILSFLIR